LQADGHEQKLRPETQAPPDTEQHYENITARNITVHNPAAQLVSIQGWTQFFDLQGKPAPSQWVTNVTLENITGTLHDFGRVDGSGQKHRGNLAFKNINITLKNPFNQTMRMLMSAGDTPEMRAAWPMVVGRILANFCRASSRRLGTVEKSNVAGIDLPSKLLEFFTSNS
jgi:hypothetical protein